MCSASVSVCVCVVAECVCKVSKCKMCVRYIFVDTLCLGSGFSFANMQSHTHEDVALDLDVALDFDESLISMYSCSLALCV